MALCHCGAVALVPAQVLTATYLSRFKCSLLLTCPGTSNQFKIQTEQFEIRPSYSAGGGTQPRIKPAET